jgi:hypothetical protein
VYDVAARTARVVFASGTILVEAPNVLPDGRLVVNGNGDLFLLDVPEPGTVLDESALVPVPMDGVPEINNDHVVDPSGESVVVSGRDGELYRVPLPDGTDSGPAVRITDAAAALPVVRKFYLHGIAPDGSALAAIVGERAVDGTWTTDVALVDQATGEPTFLTRDGHPDDGSAISPDGAAVLFSTERFSPGSAELAVLRLADGAEPVRLTNDERVNWFPHVSPDAEHLLYLSYEPGTAGHPADRRVELRLLPGALARGARMMPVPETLVSIEVGGQGTINVPPWSPDGRWFAFCDYPLAR